MAKRKAKVKRKRTPRRGRRHKAAAEAAAPTPAAEPPIASWQEADPAVARLGQVETAIAEIHADAAARAAPLEAERKALIDRVHVFAEDRPDDFAGRRRGVRLQAGRVTLRPAERLVFHRDREQVVRALQDRGLDAALFTTTRVSQDVLATFPNRILSAVGVERQTGSELVIEAGGAGRPIRRLRWPAPVPQEPPGPGPADAPGRRPAAHTPTAAEADRPEPSPATAATAPETGDDADGVGRGLACPRCGSHRSTVRSSGPADGGRIRRRRECHRCGARFSTFETLIEGAVDATSPDGPAAAARSA